MKSNLTKRRYKAQKRSACAMCKPHKRGWEARLGGVAGTILPFGLFPEISSTLPAGEMIYVNHVYHRPAAMAAEMDRVARHETYLARNTEHAQAGD